MRARATGAGCEARGLPEVLLSWMEKREMSMSVRPAIVCQPVTGEGVGGGGERRPVHQIPFKHKGFCEKGKCVVHTDEGSVVCRTAHRWRRALQVIQRQNSSRLAGVEALRQSHTAHSHMRHGCQLGHEQRRHRPAFAAARRTSIEEAPVVSKTHSELFLANHPPSDLLSRKSGPTGLKGNTEPPQS